MFPADKDVLGAWSGAETSASDSSSWDAAPVALVVVDADQRLLRMNRAASGLLSVQPGDRDDRSPEPTRSEPPVGTLMPFDVATPDTPRPDRVSHEVERIGTWQGSPDEVREFAYRASQVADGTMVAFRDVTALRRRQRRIATVARSAARVASERSLSKTLNAMAREVLEVNELAGVQILTADTGGELFHVMGSAGFASSESFFALLMECKQRGAPLKMLDAFTSGRHVVVHDRYDKIMSDPSWDPLKEYLRSPRWGSFASVPLLVRGTSVGVLNAFFSPGRTVGLEAMDFLSAMAEQAALAVDYAALIERERTSVRRIERQRMARDIHDSVVQQVFSISMQTQTLMALSGRSDTTDSAAVASVVGEIEDLTRTALRDLRSLISELHPTVPIEHGLGEALIALAAETRRRSTSAVDLLYDSGVAALQGELAEDIFLIVAEAVHNAIKHSGAASIGIRVESDGESGPGVYLSVTDDGSGLPTRAGTDGGYGLTSMRERATSNGGTVTVESPAPEGTCGTRVRAFVPRVRHSSRTD